MAEPTTPPASPPTPDPTASPTAGPFTQAVPEPPKTDPVPLHDDPMIAKALEGLTDAQRETLLTTGGKNALAARAEEVRNAKAAAVTAADAAKAEMAQSIGKALGLVQDEPLDPAKLTQELTAEKTAAQQARVELAVFKAASAANGDPAALLDSTSFLASLKDVDPADTTAVQAAITAAVTANPRLGVAPADPAAPRPPAPNPAQGAGGNGPATEAPQLTQQDVERLYAEKKYDEIDKAREEGRLSKVLGA